MYKKLFKKIAVIVSYALATAVVIGGTVLLVAYGQGYSYDFASHTFISNGLLILNTVPGGAQLQIDGKLTRHKTPYRSTLRVGSYALELTKPGFRTWHRTVDIVATEVENLASIIMVPNTIVTSTVANSAHVSSIVASSDRKHVAYLTDGSNPGLWAVNVDNAAGTKVYTPAAASGDTPAQQILSASLSRDGSRALVRVQESDKVHVLDVDMSGGAQTDLTTTFGNDFNDLRFSFDNADLLYWLSSDGLRRIDVNARTASAVLASNVVSYTYQAADKIIYAQKTDSGTIIASMNPDGGGATTLVPSVSASDSYALAYANYHDHEALGVVPASTGQLTVYQAIYSANVTSRLVAKNVKSILSSDDGHYVVFAHDKGYGSYDVLRDHIFDGQYTDAVDGISWFNGMHVIVSSGNMTRLAEFDGANSYDLGASVGTAAVGMFDQHRILFMQTDAKTGQNRLTIADLRK